MLTIIGEVMNKTGNRGSGGFLSLRHQLLNDETSPVSLVSWVGAGGGSLAPRLTIETKMKGLNPVAWALVGVLPGSVQSEQSKFAYCFLDGQHKLFPTETPPLMIRVFLMVRERERETVCMSLLRLLATRNLLTEWHDVGGKCANLLSLVRCQRVTEDCLVVASLRALVHSPCSVAPFFFFSC